MNRVLMLTLLSLAQVGLLAGCGSESRTPSAPKATPSLTKATLAAHEATLAADLEDADGPRWSDWSEPVHLDAPVNSPYHELGGTFSRNELSIYFGSDRPGGQGGFDIWVARRACRTCPWGDPVNLGPGINSAKGEGSATLSRDGHLLFFSSGRAGGYGGEDLWVSHRADPEDDLGWEPAVNLGPDVNTAAPEQMLQIFKRGEHGGYDLVFYRANLGWYQTQMTPDGVVLGPAVPVAEINDLAAADPGPPPAGARDEFYFQATRPGSALTDIYVSWRRSFREPWSAAHHLGAPINTPGADLTPSLSADGRTLLFAESMAARPSLGFQDLWISTRTRLGDDQ